MPYSVLTTIAMSTSYLLLIDDAVFDDWISAYVFISEGEVPPPLAVHVIAPVQWPMHWPVQRACTRGQAAEIFDKAHHLRGVGLP